MSAIKENLTLQGTFGSSRGSSNQKDKGTTPSSRTMHTKFQFVQTIYNPPRAINPKSTHAFENQPPSNVYLNTPPTPAHPRTNPLRASLITPPPNQTSLQAPLRKIFLEPGFPPSCMRTVWLLSISRTPSISPPLLPGKNEPAPAPPERWIRTAWNNPDTKIVPRK